MERKPLIGLDRGATEPRPHEAVLRGSEAEFSKMETYATAWDAIADTPEQAAKSKSWGGTDARDRGSPETARLDTGQNYKLDEPRNTGGLKPTAHWPRSDIWSSVKRASD